LSILDVVKGLHAGVSVSLDEPVYCIGASDEADLVLRDSGIAPRHTVLRLEGKIVAVEAVGGDVFASEKRIPQGKGLRLPLPVELTLGEAHVRLSLPVQRSAPASTKRAWYVRQAGIMAICGAVLLLSVYKLIGVSEAEDRSLPLLSVSEQAVVENSTFKQPDPEVSVRQQLQEKLEQAGLSTVHLQAQGRHLTLSGEIEQAQQSVWVDVQKWFDGAYGSSHVLISSVSIRKAVAKPRVRFQAVWLGQDPYVISESGTRLYPGAALDDGWVLKQINPEHIVLSRNGSEFSLTL
jgi:hypothetical protein